MIPRLPQGIADLALKLATGIAPETSSRFAMANTGMIAMLLGAAAVEAQRGIATRMADIDELKALFATLEATADPPGAAGRALFRDRVPVTLNLADVEALHGEGLRLLIALHCWAEEHDAGLDRLIWDFLARHTERHRIDLPGPG